MEHNSSADQAYLDAYFMERRGREVRRLIVAVFALLIGLLIAGFAEQIAVFVNASENLDIPKWIISTFGLVINLCGFGTLITWIFDGKDYVFPRKPKVMINEYPDNPPPTKVEKD